VERNPSLTVPFGSGNFRTAQSTRTLNLYALSSHAHCPRYTFFHGAPKSHATLQLQGDIFGHELAVKIRPSDFMNVDVGFTVSKLGDFFF
jgi:hypothetical protein